MKPHTNILLMRHGESLANADRALGLEDKYTHSGGVESDSAVPLTQFGYDTAKMAGRHIYQWIKDNHLTEKKITIIHSPYLRTIQTKDGVVEGLICERHLDNEDTKLDIEVLPEDLIHEQEFGILTNITSGDAIKNKPELLDAFKRFQAERKKDKNAATPEGGESRFQVMERIDCFLEKHAATLSNPDRLVIVVSHGLVMRIIEKQATEQIEEWLKKSQNHENCAVVALKDDGGREQIIQGYKRLMHLPKGYKAVPYGECESEKLCLQR